MNKSKFFSSLPILSLRTPSLPINASRDAFDQQVECFKSRTIEEKRCLPGISAVFRVKNGQHSVATAIASVSQVASEIVFVDNNSTDKTLETVESLRKWLEKRNTSLSIIKYTKQPCRAGEGYSDALKENPSGSLAEFYNFAFSNASLEYCFKFDAHYMLTPRGAKKIQKLISRSPDAITLNIRDIYGRNHGFEPLIFRNDGSYKFEDGEFFELLRKRDGTSVPRLDRIRNLVWSPTIIHIKRLMH